MYICTQPHTHRQTHPIPCLRKHTTTTTKRAITRINATTVGQTILMTSKTKLWVLSSTSGPSEEGVEPVGNPVSVEEEPAIAVSELHSSVTTIGYCIAGVSVTVSDHWEWRQVTQCGAYVWSHVDMGHGTWDMGHYLRTNLHLKWCVLYLLVVLLSCPSESFAPPSPPPLHRWMPPLRWGTVCQESVGWRCS